MTTLSERAPTEDRSMTSIRRWPETCTRAREMKGVLSAVTLAVAMAAPAIARADDPPPLPPPTQQTTTTANGTVDTVHLRNGGMYRGHVTEILPGDHVTIIVEGKAESQRIPWPEV